MGSCFCRVVRWRNIGRQDVSSTWLKLASTLVFVFCPVPTEVLQNWNGDANHREGVQLFHPGWYFELVGFELVQTVRVMFSGTLRSPLTKAVFGILSNTLESAKTSCRVTVTCCIVSSSGSTLSLACEVSGLSSLDSGSSSSLSLFSPSALLVGGFPLEKL